MIAPPRAMLATDLDGTMVGDAESLTRLNAAIASRREGLALVYVTGRSLASTHGLIAEAGLLTPDVIISDVGGHIHHGPHWTTDIGWHQRMARGWSPSRVRAVAGFFPALTRQPPESQTAFKCSYYLDEADAAWVLPELDHAMRWHRVQARTVYSSGRDLDFVPVGGGKGNAVRYLAGRFGLPLGAVVCCGDSGNDLDMLTMGFPAALVANAQPELARTAAPIYRAKAAYAAGVHEAMAHFGLL